MDEKEYIDSRVDNQITWYDRKSTINKKWHIGLRIAEIVSAALIVLFTGGLSSHPEWSVYVVSGLGVIVAIGVGITSLFHFQENWIQYRSTCETLRHEKYLYATRVTPYDVSDPFTLFVNRIESLISKEHTAWSQYIQKPKEERHG